MYGAWCRLWYAFKWSNSNGHTKRKIYHENSNDITYLNREYVRWLSKFRMWMRLSFAQCKVYCVHVSRTQLKTTTIALTPTAPQISSPHILTHRQSCASTSVVYLIKTNYYLYQRKSRFNLYDWLFLAHKYEKKPQHENSFTQFYFIIWTKWQCFVR